MLNHAQSQTPLEKKICSCSNIKGAKEEEIEKEEDFL
ncbi:hypothetical protein LINPERHAP1_LOCUS21314 [Linum perenne]